jgi:hypothetical protein
MRSQRGASPHWHAALSATARPHVMLTAAWSSQYLESVTVVLLLLLFEGDVEAMQEEAAPLPPAVCALRAGARNR